MVGFVNDGLPAVTPPAHVRPATMEELERRVVALERHDTETYTALRELSAKLDKNHLVMLDSFGELARMLGKEIATKKPLEVPW